MADDKKSHELGSRKPPKAHRFKPGQSGNPKGRPKGTVNLKTDLAKELSEQIRIREGDRNFKISKQRAMIKALVAKALKGDPRSATILIGLIAKLIEPQQSGEGDEALGADDLAIIENFIARRAQLSSSTAETKATPTPSNRGRNQKE